MTLDKHALEHGEGVGEKLVDSIESPFLTLPPRDQFAGSVPVGVRSLPGSSRKSSTEPMDTDEGVKTTRKIMESVCVARGRVHFDSEGYLPDTISHLLSARSRREGP